MDNQTRQWFQRIDALLARQEWMLRRLVLLSHIIISKENDMADVLDGITAEVARNTTVVQSALTLIQSLHDLIVAAGTDPVKLKAITDSLQANDDQLAAAVAANTPTPPTP